MNCTCVYNIPCAINLTKDLDNVGIKGFERKIR